MNKNFMRHWVVPGCVTLIMMTLGACATGTDEPLQGVQPQYARLIENDGRVEFVENRISDRREQVLLRAATSFGLEPQCSYIKSGLLGSRRAITVEDCVYELFSEELAYAGTPIEKVTYRFVDDRLFQMQFAFRNETGAGARVQRIGESVSGDLQLSRAVGRPDSQRWQSKSDVIEVLQDPAVGTTALQISDALLLERVIAQY